MVCTLLGILFLKYWKNHTELIIFDIRDIQQPSPLHKISKLALNQFTIHVTARLPQKCEKRIVYFIVHLGRMTNRGGRL